jgi:hypothetical protein
MQLTARQATLVHGWIRTKPTLNWPDVVSLKHTMDSLLAIGLTANELLTIQPDPAHWTRQGGATLKHLRLMMLWPANPFEHFHADLADLLGLHLKVDELVRMNVTYDQLVRNGMTARTESMFKFCKEEWAVMGK